MAKRKKMNDDNGKDGTRCGISDEKFHGLWRKRRWIVMRKDMGGDDRETGRGNGIFWVRMP